MPRQKRADEADSIYHALNRGNARQTMSHEEADYQAFLRVLGEGLKRYPVELFSFVLMPNHWHMVLLPSEDGLMGRMLRGSPPRIRSVTTLTIIRLAKGTCTSHALRAFRLPMMITFWLSAAM